MYNNHQNYFLPDGLSNSSSSSIESAFTVANNENFGSLTGDNPAFRRHLDHVINGKEGKMFVGGLSWLSTTDSMRVYFERFGPVEECVIMRDAKTKITRGFGFVTFVDPSDINRVLTVKDHFLDGKKIDPQIAIRHISPARSVNNICRKVFIGGVSQHCSVEDVKQYFSQFGHVEDAILKMDYPKHQHRGFGFMTFVQSETADLVCAIRYHVLKDKTVECKMAQKKEFVKPNGEAAAAASTFLNSLPPEQVLAIYGVLLKGIVANGPTATPNQQQLQVQLQQVYQKQLQQQIQSQNQSFVPNVLPKLPNPIAPPTSSTPLQSIQNIQNIQAPTQPYSQQQFQQKFNQLLLDETPLMSNFRRQITLKYLNNYTSDN